MDALVMDGSVTLGFLLRDEQDQHSLQALDAIEKGVPTFVPAHWPVEVANGLLVAERRNRATQATVSEHLKLVFDLPVMIDDEAPSRAASDTYSLARQFGLTAYDAAYLELAMRRGATLATTDRDLLKAAKAAGVPMLNK